MTFRVLAVAMKADEQGCLCRRRGAHDVSTEDSGFDRLDPCCARLQYHPLYSNVYATN